ncbi:hypothetical protein B0H63DRAFT_45337 [Podospora didyma]|uniref:PSI domain-containing protein n=1 Tax=Podospora didyma TaxID=330526 RepID=A0AAE0U8I7_9PEZI|nr:hypothetical protein B0H63DRAFT_45337 [Podospora didyma]
MNATTTTTTTTTTTARNQDDGGDSDNHLRRCWKQQSCNDCLDQDKCSWCPYTQSCVPNSYEIPLLAPAYDEHICPQWSERWEIRTKPLGCQVSTITSLTAVVSVTSTLVLVMLIWLCLWVVRRLRRLHRERPAWWRVRGYQEGARRRWMFWRRERGWKDGSSSGSSGIESSRHEQEPLLGR